MKYGENVIGNGSISKTVFSKGSLYEIRQSEGGTFRTAYSIPGRGNGAGSGQIHHHHHHHHRHFQNLFFSILIITRDLLEAVFNQ